MNTAENKTGANLRPIVYWRLWLLNAVLVSVGALYFLTVQYGTYEFFGKACLMALLPFIPVMVLAGGAGSTIFALTKVMIEKRSLRATTARALLVGPGLLLTLLLGLLGAGKSPVHRLDYICYGHVPVSVGHVRVTGYSTFFREDWLAVFNVKQKDFQRMVTEAKLVPADDFELGTMLEHSALKETRLYQSLPPLKDLPCFKRVFKEGEEHKRGSIYAAFDPATATAIVWRGHRD